MDITDLKSILEIGSIVLALVTGISGLGYALYTRRNAVQRNELEVLILTLDAVSRDNKRLSSRLDNAEDDLGKWERVAGDLRERVKELERIEKTLISKIGSLEDLNELLQSAVGALVKEREELQKSNVILLEKIDELERRMGE
jgi:chromosome segregation ATPase